MWVGVDMQVEVVGGRNAEIRRGWRFLTPRGRYRAYSLDIAWPLEMHGGECIGSMQVDVNRCGHCSIGVLHSENRWGHAFWAAKSKNEPCELGFGLGCINPGADCRVSLWGKIYAILHMLVHGDGEIMQGAGFGVQNRKLTRAASVLARGVQIQAQWVQGVISMACTWPWGPALN